MSNNKLDKSVLVELIEIAKKFQMNEFYFKNEHLEFNVVFSDEIKSKPIVENELAITKKVENIKNEKVVIKSKYVAKIKLKNTENNFFVKIGDRIKDGTKIAEYEYLNITLDLKSPCNGIVSEILVKHNDIVDYNKILIVIEKY